MPQSHQALVWDINQTHDSMKLPNGTHFRPSGKKNGSVNVSVRFTPRVVRNVNANFRGKWVNAENIGKDEADIIAQWNAAHPDDLIEE